MGLLDFFEKKKKDHKFKSAGQGHSLTAEGPARPDLSQRTTSKPQPLQTAMTPAAEAALRRQQGPPPKPKKPSVSSAGSMSPVPSHSPPPNTIAQLPVSLSSEAAASSSPRRAIGVLRVLCPFCSKPVTFDERGAHVGKCAAQCWSAFPHKAALAKVLACAAESRAPCIKILNAYLDNLISNPEEAKFRRIPCHNKVFAQRVHPHPGAEDFLVSLGFQRCQDSNPVSGELEDCLVLSAQTAVDAETQARMQESKTLLREGLPEGTLFRDPRLFQPSAAAIRMSDLPPEFFQATASEVMSMQASLTAKREELETLRPKSAVEKNKEKEKEKRKQAYPYTCLRVKFPDGWVLQGVFKSTESIKTVLDFVQHHLVIEGLQFYLVQPGTNRVFRDDMSEADARVALENADLAPCSTLNFFCADKEFNSLLRTPEIVAENPESDA
eukprot:Rmarinus@m.27753